MSVGSVCVLGEPWLELLVDRLLLLLLCDPNFARDAFAAIFRELGKLAKTWPKIIPNGENWQKVGQKSSVMLVD